MENPETIAKRELECILLLNTFPYAKAFLFNIAICLIFTKPK
jgi:hypothetical protein